MSEDKGILWAAHHHKVNTCKHPEIIKPDPPEPIWFEKKPYKCVQCGEQLHATAAEEVNGKMQIKDYSQFRGRRGARRSGKPETWSDYPRGKDCS
jgi:hypothetical protein